MLTPPIHGRATSVEDNVRIWVRELLRAQGLHVGYEHSSATHARHVEFIQHGPTFLSIATSRRKFEIFVRENRVARVASYGKHILFVGVCVATFTLMCGFTVYTILLQSNETE